MCSHGIIAAGSIVLENNIIQDRPMVVAAVSPRDSLMP